MLSIVPRYLLMLTLALVSITGCSERDRFAPLPADAVVLAFGDSITAGVGASREFAYPARLAATTGWQVINAGVSGDTAQAAGKRLTTLLATHQPAVLILELGGNDFLRQTSAARVQTYLHGMIREARASGALVVLVAVPGLSLLRASIGALSDSPIYAELAREEGVILVPAVLSDILSDESLRADEIHPNALGHEALSTGILAVLGEVGLFLPPVSPTD